MGVLLSGKNGNDKLLFNYNFLIVDLKLVYNPENGYYPRNQNKVEKKAFSWVSINTGSAKLKQNTKKYRRSKISEKSFHIEADFPSLYVVDYDIAEVC